MHGWLARGLLSSTFHISQSVVPVGSQGRVGGRGGRFTEASIKTSVETENNKLAGNLWSYQTKIATEPTKEARTARRLMGEPKKEEAGPG